MPRSLCNCEPLLRNSLLWSSVVAHRWCSLRAIAWDTCWIISLWTMRFASWVRANFNWNFSHSSLSSFVWNVIRANAKRATKCMTIYMIGLSLHWNIQKSLTIFNVLVFRLILNWMKIKNFFCLQQHSFEAENRKLSTLKMFFFSRGEENFPREDCARTKFSTPAWKNCIKRMPLQENDQSVCCYRELKKGKIGRRKNSGKLVKSRKWRRLGCGFVWDFWEDVASHVK